MNGGTMISKTQKDPTIVRVFRKVGFSLGIVLGVLFLPIQVLWWIIFRLPSIVVLNWRRKQGSDGPRDNLHELLDSYLRQNPRLQHKLKELTKTDDLKSLKSYTLAGLSQTFKVRSGDLKPEDKIMVVLKVMGAENEGPIISKWAKKTARKPETVKKWVQNSKDNIARVASTSPSSNRSERPPMERGQTTT